MALQPSPQTPELLDLRGVQCPLNWARAKVSLEGMPAGSRLAVLVDDPRAVQNLPRAAEASGHAVVQVLKRPEGWEIELER